MEPIFEADFQPVSYGFRLMRRAHDAIAEIHRFGTSGYRWVLDADIEACFDNIDHTVLMDRGRIMSSPSASAQRIIGPTETPSKGVRQVLPIWMTSPGSWWVSR